MRCFLLTLVFVTSAAIGSKFRIYASAGGVGMPLCASFLRQPTNIDEVPTADPKLYLNRKVYIHKNHDGKWSVRTQRGGRLLFHAKSVELEEASFIVVKAIRSRAARRGRRIQHAGIVGKLKSFEPQQFDRRGWTEIDYRPHEMTEFETSTSRTAVTGASRVYFEDSMRVFAVSLDEKKELEE